MRLKYLTFCLLTMSLTACSSNVIKSNSNTAQNLPERAIQGINAMYSYPSYDYRGKVQFNIGDSAEQKKLGNSSNVDPELQSKISQFLQEQKIRLDAKQKQQLFTSLNKNSSNEFSEIVDQSFGMFQTMMNDMQLSYDGTVNYRQKAATMNLGMKYNKPNLSYDMRIPMAVDFKDYKFYSNVFALAPFLSSTPNAYEQYIYFDFSKYKDQINRVKVKELAELLKETSAITYLITPKDQVQSIALSAADKNAGVVEKIRIHSSVEEVFQQNLLFATANREYITKTVLGFDEKALASDSDEAIDAEALTAEEMARQAAEEATAAADAAASPTSADHVVAELIELIYAQKYGDDEDDEETSRDATAAAAEAADEEEATTAYASAAEADEESAEDDADASDAVADRAADARSEEYLSRQNCLDLAKQKQNVAYGDFVYCNQEQDVDVFKDSSVSKAEKSEKKSELIAKFTRYGQEDKLLNAQEFKNLWFENQKDIDAVLPAVKDRSPLIMDVGLDASGRAVKLDYDLSTRSKNMTRDLNVKFDVEISNYGKASKIDYTTLKQAKSFKEAIKGTIFERIMGGGADRDESELSFDEQLEVLAEKVYKQTGSYEKTYKAVFIAKMGAENPDLVKRYSSRDLQDIAAIYAYNYSNQDIYNPTGNALKTIEALQKKHHLESDEQYDSTLGAEVDEIVAPLVKDAQKKQVMQKLVKQYKKPEAIFAQYYIEKYQQENEVRPDEKADLSKTAAILAKVYTAAQKQQLSQKTIQGLNDDLYEYVDYDLFKETYKAVQDAGLK